MQSIRMAAINPRSGQKIGILKALHGCSIKQSMVKTPCGFNIIFPKLAHEISGNVLVKHNMQGRDSACKLN